MRLQRPCREARPSPPRSWRSGLDLGAGALGVDAVRGGGEGTARRSAGGGQGDECRREGRSGVPPAA